jgi:hypothetical protein
MAGQHNALEGGVSAWVSIRNHLKCTRHSLEFPTEERLGLVRGCIHRWIVKAFDCLVLRNARRKFEREFDVELYGTDDDRELMSQRMRGANHRDGRNRPFSVSSLQGGSRGKFYYDINGGNLDNRSQY